MNRFLRRVLAVALIFALLITPTQMCARDWADAAAKVESSLVIITHPVLLLNEQTGEIVKAHSICTGFSTGAGYFFTAYHCLNEGTAKDLLIDGQTARLLFASKDMDLAVITGNVHKPGLQYSLKPLRKGDQIATLGHGYGFKDTLFRAGYVAHPSIDLGPEFGPEYLGQWLLFDAQYIGGMSGGPVFNQDGQVVGIVQQADGYSGFGLNIETILVEAGFFWR